MQAAASAHEQAKRRSIAFLVGAIAALCVLIYELEMEDEEDDD